MLRGKIDVKLVIFFSSEIVISNLKDSSFGGILDWNINWCEMWSKYDGSRNGNRGGLYVY